MAERVSLIGCLQEGQRGAYILTELNSPAHPDSSNPSVVEHERVAAAENAYRLTSSPANVLSKLVGRRVRVDGTLAKPSDLVASNAADRVTGTAGRNHEAKAVESGQKITQSDLAEVNVSSVKKLANTCGTQAARSRLRSKRR